MSRVRLLISDDGYRYVGHGHPSDSDFAVIEEHRLTAYAWGMIDSLGDEREIHHRDRSPLHTAEENLEALSRDRHVEAHMEEAISRGETPPKWVLRCLPFDVRNDLVDGDGELRGTEGRT